MFYEEPLAQTSAEAVELNRRFGGSSVPVQVGFQRRHDAAFSAVREAIERGELGVLSTVRCAMLDPEPPPPASSRHQAGSSGTARSMTSTWSDGSVVRRSWRSTPLARIKVRRTFASMATSIRRPAAGGAMGRHQPGAGHHATAPQRQFATQLEHPPVRADPAVSSGSWPMPANYAPRGTRSKCTTSGHRKTSTPRGININPNGSRGWPPAAARPWSSAAPATRTSTITDATPGNHDEHRRASCYEIGHGWFGGGPSLSPEFSRTEGPSAGTQGCKCRIGGFWALGSRSGHGERGEPEGHRGRRAVGRPRREDPVHALRRGAMAGDHPSEETPDGNVLTNRGPADPRAGSATRSSTTSTRPAGAAAPCAASTSRSRRRSRPSRGTCR